MTQARLLKLTMEDPLWILLDRLEYTLRHRASAEGHYMPVGYTKVFSALVAEALLSNAEEINREYDETRRAGAVVRLANIPRRHEDPELADIVRFDGGGSISYLPEESAGSVLGDAEG